MAYRSRSLILLLAVHYDCNTLVAVKKEMNARTFFSKIPKTVLVICAAAVPGFVVGIFVDEKTSTQPVLNTLLNGLFGALGYSICAAYIAAVIFSWMKGKRVFAVIGIILLFVPGMSLLPV